MDSINETEAETFCYCSHCQSPILERTNMISLSLSTDFIKDVSTVVPDKMSILAHYCEPCGAGAQRSLQQFLQLPS